MQCHVRLVYSLPLLYFAYKQNLVSIEVSQVYTVFCLKTDTAKFNCASNVQMENTIMFIGMYSELLV